MTCSRRLIAALIAVIAMWTPVAAADAEHERLAAMCGTWDVEMTLWTRPGGPGIATRATSTIRPLLNGLFVEEKIEGALNGAPFTTLAWTGYNTWTHQVPRPRGLRPRTARASPRPGATTKRRNGSS